jgi:hypothetical protein
MIWIGDGVWADIHNHPFDIPVFRVWPAVVPGALHQVELRAWPETGRSLYLLKTFIVFSDKSHGYVANFDVGGFPV